MHEPLDGVDAVVVPEDPVDGRPPIALPAAPRDLLLHPRDQRLEELPDPHVLRDVRRGVAEFILQEGVCPRFLDKADDGVGVPVL